MIREQEKVAAITDIHGNLAALQTALVKFEELGVGGERNSYEGKLRRQCERCGVEVEVVRPMRPLGATASQKQRKAYAADIHRQVLWQALCDEPQGCRAWWSGLIRRIENGVVSRNDLEARETAA